MFMDCVALCFIFELDEYSYHFFTDKGSRTVVGELPPVQVPACHFKRLQFGHVFGLYFRPLVNMATIACMSYLVYNYNCSAYHNVMRKGLLGGQNTSDTLETSGSSSSGAGGGGGKGSFGTRRLLGYGWTG